MSPPKLEITHLDPFQASYNSCYSIRGIFLCLINVKILPSQQNDQQYGLRNKPFFYGKIASSEVLNYLMFERNFKKRNQNHVFELSPI